MTKDTDLRFDQKNETLVIKWHDNKPVALKINYSGVKPLGHRKRCCLKEKKEIRIPTPEVKEKYVSHVDGLDMLDKQLSIYRIRFKN